MNTCIYHKYFGDCVACVYATDGFVVSFQKTAVAVLASVVVFLKITVAVLDSVMVFLKSTVAVLMRLS